MTQQDVTDDSTGSTRESSKVRRLKTRRKRTWMLLAWLVGPIVFVFLCIGTARLAIRAAENDLPESVRRSAGYPVGTIVIAGRDGDPVYFAGTVQELRDFYFKFPTTEKRRDADAESMNIRRIFGRVELATIKSDADAVKVTVRSGPLTDTVYWIHVTQLPKTP